MLSYLLDENVSPVVGEQVRAHRREIPVQNLHAWRGGQFLRTEDDDILLSAYEEQLTLVTFDLSTIPDLLARMAAEGIPHAGVILIDEKTIPPHDFGGLMHALIACWDLRHEWDWTDRVVFLERPPGQ